MATGTLRDHRYEENNLSNNNESIAMRFEQEFERLQDLEKKIVYWLAINREPVSAQELQSDFIEEELQSDLFIALKSLEAQSFISFKESKYALKLSILESATRQLIKTICKEIEDKTPLVFEQYAILKTNLKDSVRKEQIDFILLSIVSNLINTYGDKAELTNNLMNTCLELQEQLQQNSEIFLSSGYLVGNILNLLIYLEADLRGLNLSNLTLRHGYFQEVALPSVNLTNSRLDKCVFTQTFSNVISVAFSSDGKHLAAGDTNGDIYLWDVTREAKLSFICRGHTNRVWSVAFSPDCNLLASGSDDKTIRLWNVTNGQELEPLAIEQNEETTDQRSDAVSVNRVFSISFSPDSSRLVSCGDGKDIKVWNVRNRSLIKSIPAHKDKIMSVAFNCFHQGDTHLIASCSEDKEVRIWNINTGECLNVMKGHEKRVWSVAFSPDASLLASGGEDKSVRVWDVNTGHPCNWVNEEGRLYSTLQGHTSWIMSVKFIDDKTLASCSDDCSIRIWDIKRGKCIKILEGQEGHKNRVWSIDFDYKFLRLASGSEDRTVRIWDHKMGECISSLRGYDNKICSVAFCPGSSILASGSDDRFIRLWDVQGDIVEPIKTLNEHNDRVWSVAFSPDGSLLASGGCDKTIRIWDVRNGYNCINTLEGHSNWVWSIAFSPNPDSQLLVSTGDDQDIKLWNVYDNESYKKLSGHRGRVWSITFSPCGTKLAGGGEDNIIRIWNLEDERCVELEGHMGWIRSLSFSPNGDYLASGSEDETIRIWNTAILKTWNASTQRNTPRLLKELKGHKGRVRSVFFSSDNSLLISGGEDKSVIIWDIKSGNQLKKLEDHTGSIEVVAFDSNNFQFASGSEDETIRIWNIENIESIESRKILSIPKPYQGMVINGLRGLSYIEKQQLKTLGAVEEVRETPSEQRF